MRVGGIAFADPSTNNTYQVADASVVARAGIFIVANVNAKDVVDVGSDSLGFMMGSEGYYAGNAWRIATVGVPYSVAGI